MAQRRTRTSKAKLEPVDLKRCQTDISYYRPFIMGGSVSGFERCKNKPEFIATETKPGSDGLKGAMSVCATCLPHLMKKGLPVSVKPIKEKKPDARKAR